MPQNNLNTIFTAVALATTAPLIQMKMSNSFCVTANNYVSYEKLYKSGDLMTCYTNAVEEFVKTQHLSSKIDVRAVEMQKRYQSMKNSFLKYSKNFPVDKQNYFSQMANALCQLDFKDNVSSFNDDDDSIDTVLKLSNGLTLSISCFIDEDVEAPMVFSIHRDRNLIVSDSLPVGEIVRTINSVRA